MPESTSVLEASSAAVVNSLQDVWVRFITFLPLLVGAILVLVIGWIIAVAVGNLVKHALKALKINDVFDRITGLKSAVQRAGFELNVAGFVGGIVKWFLIIVSLLAATDILGLTGVSVFLNQVVAYIPNIVVATVMIIAGTIFANFVQKIAKASAETAKLPHGSGAAAIVKWAVLIFTFLAALIQLGIAPELLQTLFTGFVALLAIAGGIAFGLGGKNVAERALGHLERDIQNREK